MKTQAYFNHIQQEILSRINLSQHSIIVAVAWLTDPIIFSSLCKKATTGLSVQLLLLDDEINRERSGIDYDDLNRAGGKVYFVEMKVDGGIMHHKFCVIDGHTLITGSYNWSRKARQNDENIVITEEADELCKNFLNEFAQIRSRKDSSTDQNADVSVLIKRLQILKNYVLLEDFEELQLQVTKLSRSTDHIAINSILRALKNKEYGRALLEVDEFIQQHQQLTIYNDPQIFALQLELKSCEVELNAIENELVELEKDLHEFTILQSQHVGTIIIEILQLRKVLAKTKFEKEDAEKDEEDFRRTYEDHKKQEIPNLSEDDRKKLTKQYREASMLCHPDKFQNEPDKLEAASQLFVQLNNAYKSNDIKKVEDILEQLKASGSMLIPGKTSTKKDDLLRQLMQIKNKRSEALIALAKLKASETYNVIRANPNKEQYFSDLKSKLSFELSLLKKEVLQNEA